MYLRMPAIKSTDPIPQEALAIRAREILQLDPTVPLTSEALSRARKAALLRNHPDKCAEPPFTCDEILNAFQELKQEAEEQDLRQAMAEDRQEKIKLSFGMFWCANDCEKCIATASIAFSCDGCSRKQGHDPECRLKKPWASCKTQEEKLRYYQVASHESFAAANADLAKQHGVAQGRAKALAEARAQFQSEKRKAESIATRFAKRQAAMLEYESCLANSPLKPQRGAASAGGASAASARDGRSAPSSFTASFTAGQQCPDCGEGQLSAKVSARGRRYLGCSSFRPGAAEQSCSFFRYL